MPYTAAQCRAFAAKAARGEKVPSDWKSYCRGKDQPSKKKKSRSGKSKRR